MRTTPDPARHPAHERPLANRIVSAQIRRWLDGATATALAGAGEMNDYERGVCEGIQRMRNLYLADWEYLLTPNIVDQLRRAGLLLDKDEVAP